MEKLITTDGPPKEEHRQIPLFDPMPVPNYSTDAFITAEENADLLETGINWLNAREPALAICGPRGSGKTHLLHVLIDHHRKGGGQAAFASSYGDAFAALSGAPAGAPQDRDKSTFLIALDPCTADNSNPQEMLDLIEDCRGRGVRLVLAGRGAPASWTGGLIDLLTRIEAMARLSMPEPSEDLLRAILTRQIAARQFSLSQKEFQSIVNYAAPRLTRTFEAAMSFTHLLDVLALTEKQRPSVKLARQAIDQLKAANSAPRGQA